MLLLHLSFGSSLSIDFVFRTPTAGIEGSMSLKTVYFLKKLNFTLQMQEEFTE